MMMKKLIILVCFILLFGQAGFAQSENHKAISVGLGPEFNMNARENFAGALSLSIDYQLPVQLAIGLSVIGSANFSETNVLEAAGIFRWYILGDNHTGLFVQTDLGLHLISERSVIKPMFGGGLRAGYRLLLGESFYIEPYGRFGFPYFYGVGVLAGMPFRFSAKASNSGE